MHPDDSPPFQDLARFRLPANFRGRAAVIVELWRLIQASLFRLSPQPCYGWRRLLLRVFGARIGRGVLIRPSARIAYPWKLSIGDHSWIGDFAELYSLGEIRIGANVVVSQYAYLCAASHDPRAPDFPIFTRPVVIEDEAWLAAGVFVHPGVTVGRGAVIGARAVLTHDARAGGIYVGSPAQRRGWRARLESSAASTTDH